MPLRAIGERPPPRVIQQVDLHSLQVPKIPCHLYVSRAKRSLCL